MKAKEAIKIIGDWISEETHKRKYNRAEIVELSEALINLKCMAEQQNNKWIPVSERLPTETGYYLCTVEWYGTSNKKNTKKIKRRNRKKSYASTFSR